jgi:SAM-dependent methyltransferase
MEASTAKGGYNPEVFEELATLEERSFWFAERNKIICWALRRYAPALGDYLELGCGTGHVLAAVHEAFPGARCVGIEPFEDGLKIARGRLRGVELRQGDGAGLDEDCAYDAIGSYDVLEHIVDDQGVLRNMARALRPGGTLVLTVPQHPWLWSDTDEAAEHVRRYRRGELVERVETAGLEVMRCTSFVTTLLPALALSRLLRRWRTSQDSLSELRMAGWAQAVLRPALVLDRLLIGAGAPLPAGGSLLLVARRP